MSEKDTKLRVLVERPGYWKANAELSEKGLDDLTQTIKQPLVSLGLKLAGLAITAGLLVFVVKLWPTILILQLGPFCRC